MKISTLNIRNPLYSTRAESNVDISPLIILKVKSLKDNRDQYFIATKNKETRNKIFGTREH